MLGHDTLYYKSVADWKLLRIAEEEGRVLITRDVGLYRRARKRGLKAILIEDTDIAKMLGLLAAKLDIRLEFNKFETRCPNCNTKLKYTTSPSELIGRVDPKILQNYREFWICPRCGKIYWQGNHWRTINEILERATFEKLKLISKYKPAEASPTNVEGESRR